mmetsp:Transcript_19663/g.29796  ORF Transcript_19663/g.29796 Transcript_19663/m.29796 type:complete len:132 (+) Transcript_19663:320-715(+)
MEVRCLKDAYAEDARRESKNYRDYIATIEESITRQDASLPSKATYILTQENTVKANEEAFINPLIALNTARDFVFSFSVIGCGTNEHESTCALQDSGLVISNDLRNLFIEGVKKGLPCKEDAVCRLWFLTL